MLPVAPFIKKHKAWVILYLISTLTFFTSAVPVFGGDFADRKEVYAIDSVPENKFSDSIVEKRFGRAVLELMLAETTPFLVDQYIRKVDYTRISFKTIGDNLSPGSWVWDGDGFTTNQFGHPYHGSQFYSAFRANGYSFWQSVPATFVGSYLWETFSEVQAPAPNDLINTGFGGVVLGEMTYRLSQKMVDNRKRGFRRQTSEVLAFMINPVNGFNRIVNGQWGKVMANSAERDSAKVYTEFDVGLRRFKSTNLNAAFTLYGHVKLLYGTPFENYKTPFSNIAVNAEFSNDDSSKVNIASVYGSLKGWRIKSKDKDRHLLLLSANYDYINNEAFFYSAESIRLHLLSEFSASKNLKINTAAGTGLILLAAVPDIYFYKERNYDYCAGIAINGSCTFGIAKHFFYTISYRGGWLRTINGNTANYFMHSITSEIRFRLKNNFSVCAEPGLMTLQNQYRNFDVVNKNYHYLRVSLRYGFTVQ
ncbi:DUF3943 domain-containing protein [Ferruginibacter paludis]|uniref:DUF3943 domain-containing protein n=1 Tax=Ferruginibacter paludis TaxID=1310417 RepID=UPI0025B5C235|nr:DUF3943 domain-containing protein [Ferruginibacter paludis]MDN3654240.1 DUF3943 domain-containing protein [Ferruginibacter paludis]